MAFGPEGEACKDVAQGLATKSAQSPFLHIVHIMKMLTPASWGCEPVDGTSIITTGKSNPSHGTAMHCLHVQPRCCLTTSGKTPPGAVPPNGRHCSPVSMLWLCQSSMHTCPPLSYHHMWQGFAWRGRDSQETRFRFEPRDWWTQVAVAVASHCRTWDAEDQQLAQAHDAYLRDLRGPAVRQREVAGVQQDGLGGVAVPLLL